MEMGTRFIVKLLVSKWNKGAWGPTRQDMRKRCVQSEDVSSKQLVDGTCRA